MAHIVIRELCVCVAQRVLCFWCVHQVSGLIELGLILTL